jgi:hypothetical protein
MSSKSGKSKSSSRAAGGKVLGKAAKRSTKHNAECVDEYVTAVMEAAAAATGPSGTRAHAQTALQMIGRSIAEGGGAMALARVTRAVGGGLLEVLLQEGETVKVPIAGSIVMKGRASTKMDRANCMCVGDIVVLRGGLASGKLPEAVADKVKRVFEAFGIVSPKSFFAAASAAAAGAGAAAAVEEDSWEWDRGAAAAAEEDEEVAVDDI